MPTDLTEGGRRLFSEKDVATLETICFLRDLDISIKDIAEILESDESKKVIELLLDELNKNLQADIKKKTEQLEKIKNIRNFLTSFKDGSQKTIHLLLISSSLYPPVNYLSKILNLFPTIYDLELFYSLSKSCYNRFD